MRSAPLCIAAVDARGGGECTLLGVAAMPRIDAAVYTMHMTQALMPSTACAHAGHPRRARAHARIAARAALQVRADGCVRCRREGQDAAVASDLHSRLRACAALCPVPYGTPRYPTALVGARACASRFESSILLQTESMYDTWRGDETRTAQLSGGGDRLPGMRTAAALGSDGAEPDRAHSSHSPGRADLDNTIDTDSPSPRHEHKHLLYIQATNGAQHGSLRAAAAGGVSVCAQCEVDLWLQCHCPQSRTRFCIKLHEPDFLSYHAMCAGCIHSSMQHATRARPPRVTTLLWYRCRVVLSAAARGCG